MQVEECCSGSVSAVRPEKQRHRIEIRSRNLSSGASSVASELSDLGQVVSSPWPWFCICKMGTHKSLPLLQGCGEIQACLASARC